MENHVLDRTNLHRVFVLKHKHPSSQRRNAVHRFPSRRYVTAVLVVLVLAALIVAGCGPEETPPALNAAERNQRILAIADEFAQSGDLDAAGAALSELGLAQESQAVLALAEAYIVEGQDVDQTLHLIGLAEALGPLSRLAGEFRAQNGSGGVEVAQAAVTVAPPTNTPVPPTETPTAEPPTETPTPESPTDTPEPTAEPTDTPVPVPRVVADSQALNVRGGPGTAYPVVGLLRQGEEADIIGRTQNGSWWQVLLGSGDEGWVFASLVTATGPTEGVTVAQNVAPPPATPTPAAPPTPTPAPQPAGPTFRLIGVRMWGVEENGGYYDGPSVHCGEKRELWVITVDAAGNPINGVTATDRFSENVTGHKGIPGKAEFVLGNAAEVRILRDAGGADVSSDSTWVSTISPDISDDMLIGAGYCRDAGDCASFKSQCGCCAHFSYDVTFQRAY